MTNISKPEDDKTVRVTNPPSTTNESPPNSTPTCSGSTTREEVETKSTPRIFQFEIINIVDLAIVIFCGIALLEATFSHSSDVVYTITGGFMGYLGGTGRSLLAQRMSQQTTKTTTTETGKDGR